MDPNNSDHPTSTDAVHLLKMVVKAEDRFLFVIEKLSRVDRVLLDKWINEKDPEKIQFQAWVKLNYLGCAADMIYSKQHFVERICARASFEKHNCN